MAKWKRLGIARLSTSKKVIGGKKPEVPIMETEP